ncbi:MbtH family NRPS accessory protein [Streptomyces sp. 2A115]|uniref:MbtH family NRPS accessory protein n=1 Tax=Streptomyces sp. 2A115 TaxID=3457439 RepID=UPI003FD55E2F
MRNSPDRDAGTFTVLRHEKSEPSLWLENGEVPLGWERLDFAGTVEERSAHVDEVWTVGPNGRD